MCEIYCAKKVDTFCSSILFAKNKAYTTHTHNHRIIMSNGDKSPATSLFVLERIFIWRFIAIFSANKWFHIERKPNEPPE